MKPRVKPAMLSASAQRADGLTNQGMLSSRAAHAPWWLRRKQYGSNEFDISKSIIWRPSVGSIHLLTTCKVVRLPRSSVSVGKLLKRATSAWSAMSAAKCLPSKLAPLPTIAKLFLAVKSSSALRLGRRSLMPSVVNSPSVKEPLRESNFLSSSVSASVHVSRKASTSLASRPLIALKAWRAFVSVLPNLSSSLLTRPSLSTVAFFRDVTLVATQAASAAVACFDTDWHNCFANLSLSPHPVGFFCAASQYVCFSKSKSLHRGLPAVTVSVCLCCSNEGASEIAARNSRECTDVAQCAEYSRWQVWPQLALPLAQCRARSATATQAINVRLTVRSAMLPMLKGEGQIN
mmetsp:Transcript_108170/g.345464  ORF Transcript_108170/g.345464 Transcript_108170/m.345464 type:complete len:348 (+) Transcript_108170:75-1118(+)